MQTYNKKGSDYSINVNEMTTNYIPANNTPNDVEFSTIQAKQNNDASQWGNLGTSLTNKATRIKFIRKVYLILTAQLIITFGIVCIFALVPTVRDFAQSDSGFYLYIASYIIFLVLIVTFSLLSICNFQRRVPWNYIMLLAITLSLAYMLGMISAYNSISSVLIAIGITFTVTLGITLISIQTKYDFTKNCALIAVCLSFALIGFGFATIFTSLYSIPFIQSVYGGLGACLMALFLAIDTQLLIGNKKYKFSSEDYINAALQLYLDICMMFLYLLGMGKK